MDSEECLWEGTVVEREEVPPHSRRWRTWRGDLEHCIKVWDYSSMHILWISVSFTMHKMSKYSLGWREREEGGEERRFHSIIYTSIPCTLNRNPQLPYSQESTWASRLKVLLFSLPHCNPRFKKYLITPSIAEKFKKEDWADPSATSKPEPDNQEGLSRWVQVFSKGRKARSKKGSSHYTILWEWPKFQTPCRPWSLIHAQKMPHKLDFASKPDMLRITCCSNGTDWFRTQNRGGSGREKKQILREDGKHRNMAMMLQGKQTGALRIQTEPLKLFLCLGHSMIGACFSTIPLIRTADLCSPASWSWYKGRNCMRYLLLRQTIPMQTPVHLTNLLSTRRHHYLSRS